MWCVMMFTIVGIPHSNRRQVTGNYVYPGVGYVVMAIEASRQLAGEQAVSGFQLRRVSIRRALIVPDTKEGIEVSVSMTTMDEMSESKTWRRFHVSSYNESTDEWTEHCTGLIAVEYKSAVDPVDNGREAEAEGQSWKEDLQKAIETCTSPLNFSKAYNNLQTAGLNFGPLFRNLDAVQTSGSLLGSMTGSVTVPDIAQSMPKQYMHSHLIHPATMDSMIHMMIAAVLDFTGKTSLDKIRLPTYIRDMWVSAELSSAPSQRFTGYASVSVAAAEKYEGRIQMSDALSHARCVHMDGIELTPLESGLGEDSERKLCTAIEWKPDPHFLDSTTACALGSVNEKDHDENIYWVKRLQLATMLYVTDALAELKGLDPMTLDLHLRRFYEWMKHHENKLLNDQIIHLPYNEFQEASQDKALRNAIFAEIEEHSAEGAITARMGRNIVAVMQQTANPLHLMFGQDDVMEGVYKEGLHLYNLPQHLHNHLSLLRHKHSGLNVLEIGGGTGSFTAEVFNVLAPGSQPTGGSIASYTFTDISSGFFEKAKHRFAPWSDIMTFQSLNIERNPIDQGFQTGSYDLIFAGNVIHATANLHTALRNLRSLLRPGGQLIMQEGIRQDFLWYPLVFGQLPGWWLGDEPIRKWCPYIPASEWNTFLTESGFSGVDIEYPSSNDEGLTWQSIMVSTALEEKRKSRPDIFILCSSRDVSQAISIQSFLQTNGASASLITPHELHGITWNDSVCISLVDLDGRFVADMNKTTYEALKQTLIHCQNILWLLPDPEIHPFAAMGMGLLRTVRWERDADGSNILTLTTPPRDEIAGENLAESIDKIIQFHFIDRIESDRHAEYLLRDNTIHIGRLREWEKADNFLSVQSSNVVPEWKRLGAVGRPIELSSLSGTGDAHWVTDAHHGNPLGATEVEVEIRAVGLDSDSNTANPGAEASGVISTIGSAVEDLVVGDRVVFLSGNDQKSCFRTVARVNQELVVKVPESIPLETAAGLPLIYSAAIYGLEDVAGISETDSVLIHTGASAHGQAAIQCAKMAGAKIYSTVASAEDREFLVSEYGIPTTHIFSVRDSSFVHGIKRSTNQEGVDVVFNTLAGEAFQRSLECVSPFGCFINVSSKSSRTTSIEMSALQQNITITSIDITSMAQRRPKLLRRLMTEVMKLYAEGKIGQIQPWKTMDFTQIKDGMRTLRETDRPGKIVFKSDPSNIIPVVPDTLPPYRFDERASYVLAGGLGGLGRSLAQWMASRGAKHLIFLSRSGRVTEPVEEMVSDLRRIGCNAYIFTCDVADASRLTEVVAECSTSLPPIKGCIQGSMVLRVSFYPRISKVAQLIS